MHLETQVWNVAINCYTFAIALRFASAGYFCSMFLFDVDIKRDHQWLCIALSRCTAPEAVFAQWCGKARLFGLLLSGFERKRQTEINLDRTDDISHVLILDMAGYDAIGYVTLVAKWYHSTFSKSASYTITYKISHFKSRWEIIKAKQYYKKYPFVSIDVPYRKTV